MIPHAKRPALAMLVGALWLTAAEPSWAGSPGTNREQFVSLLANKQNLALINRLQHQVGQSQQQAQRLENRLQNLSSQAGNPGVNPGAIDRLRTELTRLNTAITNRLATIQRLERGSATPSAPGGF
jgi:hypothetical protein